MEDNRDKKTLLYLALIAGVAVVAYLPALQAGFIWDDDAYVVDNPALRGSLFQIWSRPFSIPQYYPLVHSTFWVEFALFGTRPFVYHLDNLVLHLVSCLLLFAVVKRLGLPGAVLAAGVFALHPVMVESVAWITERKNVLSMVLYLGATLVYLRREGFGIVDGSVPVGDSHTSGSWWLAFGLFAGALASKSVTFSWPFAMMLVVFWKRGRVTRQQVISLLPFVLLGIAYGAFTSYLESTHVGANGPEWEQTIVEKVLIAGRVPWFYLAKLAWPVDLTFIYPRWEIDASAAWQWSFPVLSVTLIVLVLILAWRKSIRAPLVAVLLFGGTLFPALGFIAVYPFRYSFVADHFQYHASLGILVPVCVWSARVIPARIGVPLACLVLGLFGARVWMQCRKYESREVLYRSILADDPKSFFAHNNIGAIHAENGEFDAAFESYLRAKNLRPIIAPDATPEAFAHCMIANVIAKKWTLRDAMQALRVSPEALIGKRDAVIQYVMRAHHHFRRSVELSPRYEKAAVDLGTLTQGLGMVTIDGDPMPYFREAVATWERVLQRNPANDLVRFRLERLHRMLASRFDRLRQPDQADAHRASAQALRAGRPVGR